MHLFIEPDPTLGKHATFRPGGDNLADEPYKGDRVEVIWHVTDEHGECFGVTAPNGAMFVVFPFELEDWS